MKHLIKIDVDREAGAEYVQYLGDAEVAGTLDVWHDGQVAADLDCDEQVIGIEVLGFDDETLAHAPEFAHKRGLGFPDINDAF